MHLDLCSYVTNVDSSAEYDNNRDIGHIVVSIGATLLYNYTVYVCKSATSTHVIYETFQHGTCSSEAYTTIQDDNLFTMLC